ncbi:DUF1800 domain-containing protein [Elizabethkingia anophelis]|uniref:DUF1800 domain-containing protein n=1 Tax=Elizabethkingia anophelis TaxID=1117645 RepID=UPI002012D4C5|nr:DUF1800 domain-containing protein [Elizabethkingia anophelis]EJC8060201.1 DUF1800 domain-containing protein [Elizabethkingia anophelis]EJC8062359.1 DUF1800 domain-containing protein [Elizabethkingia anophelis]MCL1643118.1 DUF1800 domain-containing protein [Elizabethkingia anophelis]MCL1643799.1 DUF1800 domain-containing protein [Elizabethkingia anophelis]MCT3926452.1 DUF1800 domain-containing protein [Elizabethkingia anophelis]
MLTNFVKNKHLLWRAGFGPKSDSLNLLNFDTLKLWKQILSDSTEADIPVIKVVDESNLLVDGNIKNDPEARKLRNQQLNRQTNQIALDWIDKMAYSPQQLREKVAFFWMGHFASRIQNSNFNQDLLNIVRQKALGNFGDLLKAVSQSASMLSFLNNQQNRKGHPNENFAREVMELFTMGRGHYTEKDIKEAARAFTGWGYDKTGAFQERPKLHDDGEKIFLGQNGNFNGNDILNIILQQKATSKFIAAKIYRFFVNEAVNDQIVDEMATVFYKSNYNIAKLFDYIFTSKWFYNEANIGTRIKSPIELFVGIQRTLPLSFEKPEVIINYGNLLGQVIFRPPNVAGWPSGTNWIDSSTLLLRMQIPQIWSGIIPMVYKPKEDDDTYMGQKQHFNPKNAKANINWTQAETVLKDQNLADLLLQKKVSSSSNVIKEYSGKSFEADVINLMSIPEYQLC